MKDIGYKTLVDNKFNEVYDSFFTDQINEKLKINRRLKRNKNVKQIIA